MIVLRKLSFFIPVMKEYSIQKIKTNDFIDCIHNLLL